MSQSDCRQVGEWITSYVDGGLESPARGLVERHTAGCPPCRTRLVQEQGARAALRQCAEGLLDRPLPPGLESRCEAIARDQASRQGARWWRAPGQTELGQAAPGQTVPEQTVPEQTVSEQTLWRTVVPLVLVVLVLIGSGIGVLSYATGRSNTVLAAQLTADHVKCFAVFRPREVTGGDARSAERRLASDGWQMHVPPSSREQGLRLLGVRRCLYADGMMPHVMYEANGRPLSLFKLDGLRRPAQVLSSLGHQCRIWQRDGCTFVLVGPGDAGPELERVARYVEQEAR